MCKSGIPLKDVKSSEWKMLYRAVDKHKTETHKTL